MASPCCPKCGKTHFVRQNSFALNVALIYCASCGAVAGTVPAKLVLSKSTSAGTTNTKSGVTAVDQWTATV